MHHLKIDMLKALIEISNSSPTSRASASPRISGFARVIMWYDDIGLSADETCCQHAAGNKANVVHISSRRSPSLLNHQNRRRGRFAGFLTLFHTAAIKVSISFQSHIENRNQSCSDTRRILMMKFTGEHFVPGYGGAAFAHEASEEKIICAVRRIS